MINASLAILAYLYNLQTRKLKGGISSKIVRLPCRNLGYERVYLPLYKVADTPFHIQGDDVFLFKLYKSKYFFTHDLEVVDRGSETQLQDGEKINSSS